MKRLTKEEADKILTKPGGRFSGVRVMLMNMNIGDILLLEPSDWKQKSKPPSTLCRIVERETTRKFTCDKAIDGSGWIIKRIQ